MSSWRRTISAVIPRSRRPSNWPSSGTRWCPRTASGSRWKKGWVTLSGQVSWEYQRSGAEKAVRPLTGVRGVSNQIALLPAAVPGDVGARIESALERHAEEQAKGIAVSVTGHTVTLRGKVDSWGEHSAASKAAWAAPGVNLVINDLVVSQVA